MEINASAVLIAFSPDACEAGSRPEGSRSEVDVIEKSVGLTEAYQAKGLGLNPEKRLLIPYELDYHGERILEYEGVPWKVIRVSGGEYNGVILTIQRETGNSGNSGRSTENAETGGNTSGREEETNATE